MSKTTKNAVDVQGLAATTTKEISIKEVKDGFKKIIEFEYLNYQDNAQNSLLEEMLYFDWNELKECIDTMDDLSTAYYEIDSIKDDSVYDEGLFEDMVNRLNNFYDALVRKNEEEFVKAYSELGIDEEVLQRIAKIVMD